MNEGALIPCLLFFTFLCSWRLFDYFKKSYMNNNMFKKVGWIAEKDCHMICYSDNVRLRDSDLISYIIKEQSNLEIPKDLYIDYSNETEKKNAEEILNIHKADVIKSYFCDFLTKSKNVCKLNSNEYYFYSLNCFIHKELNEYKHHQDKIYSDKEYTDKTHFTCQLTDYGRTFYKLYLITLIYTEKNENIKKLFEYINPKLKMNIMEHLKTNEISFWTYRP